MSHGGVTYDVALSDELLDVALVRADAPASHAADRGACVDDKDKLDGLALLVTRAGDAEEREAHLRNVARERAPSARN